MARHTMSPLPYRTGLYAANRGLVGPFFSPSVFFCMGFTSLPGTTLRLLTAITRRWAKGEGGRAFRG